jgi:hypothetical protein
MPLKFEWQFKHRDERFLNARPARARKHTRKPSIHAGFLHFRGFRFTLPVGDRVTIAHARRGADGTQPYSAVLRHMQSASGLRVAYPSYGPARSKWESASSPGINRTGGKDEGVGNTSGSCLPASCRRLRIKDPPVEERRSLHDQHLCRTVAREPRPFAITIQPFDLMSRRHPLSSIGACAPMTAPALLPA